MSDRLEERHAEIEELLRELEKPRGECSSWRLHDLIEQARNWMAMERFIVRPDNQHDYFSEAAAAISTAHRLQAENEKLIGEVERLRGELDQLEDLLSAHHEISVLAEAWLEAGCTRDIGPCGCCQDTDAVVRDIWERAQRAMDGVLIPPPAEDEDA